MLSNNNENFALASKIRFFPMVTHAMQFGYWAYSPPSDTTKLQEFC